MSDEHHDKLTSTGLKLSDVPDDIRDRVIWIDGIRGKSKEKLPTQEEVPTPEILQMDGDTRVRFPNWMTGAKAMMDAHGVGIRLNGCRPGAWLISPLTGLKWAVWPDGSIDQVPKDIELPMSLRVSDGRQVH